MSNRRARETPPLTRPRVPHGRRILLRLRDKTYALHLPDPTLVERGYSPVTGTGVALRRRVAHALSVTTLLAAQRRELDLLLLEHMRIRADGCALFLECGDGWVVEEFWRRARRGMALGVDRSGPSIARASSLRAVPGAVEFQTWDGRRLPCRDASCHQVVATLLLETVLRPADVLSEIHRVLHPRGEFYCLEREAFARSELPTHLGGNGFGRVHDVVPPRAIGMAGTGVALVRAFRQPSHHPVPV